MTRFEIEPGLLDRRILEQQQPLAAPELSAPQRASMLWLHLQQKQSSLSAASSGALQRTATPPAIEVQAVVRALQPPPAEPGLRRHVVTKARLPPGCPPSRGRLSSKVE